MKVKYSIIFFIITSLLVAVIIFTSYRRNPQISETPDPKLNNSLILKEIIEPMARSESTFLWNKIESQLYKLTISTPPEWTYQELSNTQCSKFAEEKRNCLKLIDGSGQNYILISAISNDDQSFSNSGGYLDKGEVLNSQLLTLSSGLEIISNEFVNGVQMYDGKKYSELWYSKDLYSHIKESQYYGIKTNFLLFDNIAYSIGYSIDPQLVPSDDSLLSVDVYNEMNQIISTLEIDFSNNPFNL